MDSVAKSRKNRFLISDAVVRRVRELSKTDMMIKDIAALLHISVDTIYDIKKGARTLQGICDEVGGICLRCERDLIDDQCVFCLAKEYELENGSQFGDCGPAEYDELSNSTAAAAALIRRQNMKEKKEEYVPYDDWCANSDFDDGDS